MLVELERMVVRIIGDDSDFQRAARRIERGIYNISRSAQILGRSMTLYLTAPIVGFGVAAVKAFSDFDQAITKSVSIIRNAAPGVKRAFEEAALAMSMRFAKSPEDIAASFYDLVSAGLSAGQAIKSLGASTEFAVAGSMRLADAVEFLVGSQTALGLRSKDATENMKQMVRVSDVLTEAANRSLGTIEEFARALSAKSGAALRLLKKPVEEGVAVLAAYADQNVRSEHAGEMLSIALRELQRSFNRASGTWKRFGLSVFDTTGKMLPLADIIQQLEQHFMGLNDQQKRTHFSMLRFQERSIHAVQALFGMSGEIRRYQKLLEDAGGATKEVADKQMQSFANQMFIMINHLKAVGIEIGKLISPYLLKLNEVIKDVVKWWLELNDNSKKVILSITVMVAAIGPLLTAFGLLGMWLNIVAVGFAYFYRPIVITAQLIGVMLASSFIRLIGLFPLLIAGFTRAGRAMLVSFIPVLRKIPGLLKTMVIQVANLSFVLFRAIGGMAVGMYAIIAPALASMLALTVYTFGMMTRVVIHAAKQITAALILSVHYFLVDLFPRALAAAGVALRTFVQTLRFAVITVGKFTVSILKNIVVMGVWVFGVAAKAVGLFGKQLVKSLYTATIALAGLTWGLVKMGVAMLANLALMAIASGAFVAVGLAVAVLGGAIIAMVVGAIKWIVKLVNWISGKKSLSGAWDDAIAGAKEWLDMTIGFFVNFQQNIGILLDWIGRNWQNLFKDALNATKIFVQNSITNMAILGNAIVRLYTLAIGYIGAKIRFMFLGNGDGTWWGSLKAFVKKAWELIKTFAEKIRQTMVRAMAGMWLPDIGESWLDKFESDLGTGMAATLLGNFGPAAQKILNEEFAKMKTPFEGFVSSVEEAPQFNLMHDFWKKKDRDDLTDDLDGVQDQFEGINNELDNLDRDVTIGFKVEGIQAVKAGSFELLTMMLNMKNRIEGTGGDKGIKKRPSLKDLHATRKANTQINTGIDMVGGLYNQVIPSINNMLPGAEGMIRKHGGVIGAFLEGAGARAARREESKADQLRRAGRDPKVTMIPPGGAGAGGKDKVTTLLEQIATNTKKDQVVLKGADV